VANGEQNAACLALVAVPIAAEASREGLFLLGGLQLGQKQRVADADFILGKCFGDGGGKLGQLDALEAIGRRFTSFGGNLLNGVFRFIEHEQGAETLRLFERVNVAALEVLDLSLVLQKLSLTYTTMGYRTSWNLYL